MYIKWTLAILLTTCYAFPVAAQHTSTHTISQTIHLKVESALQRAQANDKANSEILYRAEELLQQDREIHAGHPEHDINYYYQQVEKSLKNKEQAQQSPTVSSTKEQDPQILYRSPANQKADPTTHVCTCGQLTPSEALEAEHELQHIRDTQDNHATFAAYPQLLEKWYKCPIHHPTTPSQKAVSQPTKISPHPKGWTRKVGL